MVLCVACSELVELLARGCFIWVKFRWVWRQTGQILGREICWHLLTGLPVVSGLENLCGWKWVDHIRSLFFLFPACPLMTIAGGTILFKVSPCSEAVLCSFLYYMLRWKNFRSIQLWDWMDQQEFWFFLAVGHSSNRSAHPQFKCTVGGEL